jgi:hypothetical protein
LGAFLSALESIIGSSVAHDRVAVGCRYAGW